MFSEDKKKQLLEIAQAYREKESLRGGVVLIFNDQAYGWKNELRDPQHECPGVFAADDLGTIWLAEGGDDYNGAQNWTSI